MKPMAKAVAGVAMLCAALAACSPFGGVEAFHCTADPDCSGGFCEADGLCSFTDLACESGHRYGSLAGGQSGKCVGAPGDGPVDQPVVQPEAGDTCYGDPAGLVRPCFAPSNLPTGAVSLPAAIDTTNDPLCSTTVINTAGVCVIAADTITVSATSLVTGTRPLVLVAVTTMQLDATIDVGSDRGAATRGAASNDAGCDGGTAATNTGGQGGGGGGGSFGTKGGDGGGIAATKGLAGAAQVPAALRGGCPGQDGKEGGGAAGTRGVGGASGGAVYLIAETSITVAAGGGVNANGAGGSTGLTNFLSAGGGGGGSGGMIVFDSPTITNAGIVAANGGGGAEGTGVNQAGLQGKDPVGIAGGGGSGNISTSGGDGAAGASGTTTGGNGATGTGAVVSGGGGGGGVGVIRVFRGAIAGQISPPAT